MTDTLKQEDLDDFLAQHGIKGMRWGIRRTEAQLARARGEAVPASTSHVQTRSGKGKVIARGGENQPASDDARNRAARQQIASKSGVDSLSNKELQELISRLNMENTYRKLNATPDPLVKRFLKNSATFVGKTAVDITKAELKRVALHQTQVKVNKKLGLPIPGKKKKKK